MFLGILLLENVSDMGLMFIPQSLNWAWFSLIVHISVKFRFLGMLTVNSSLKGNTVIKGILF